ncbi:Hypothetical predicted protein [Octopus vulgaris]|uniref:Uncharacterized protein n=1 Tax=Octopus vulgaris TaxID=6645 RepID=A0AA36BP93_OCTVU|nr:Hypothetical predicted protein [Octopus vulgaris]
MKSSVEVLGLPARKHQDWFNDNNTDVQQLIDKMHISHKTWINDKSPSRKENVYKKCRGQVQHALRQMKEALNSKKLQTERILKLFKKVYGPQEHGVTPFFFHPMEILLTDKSDILKRWKDHFEAELKSTSVTNDDVIMSIPQQAEIPELSLEPTFLEVVNSVKQISSGKAPGMDAVPPEIYKYGGQKRFKKLHNLFINI